MRTPLSWIRDFAPGLTAPVDEIVTALNQLGLEVEGVDEPGRELGGIVAARVLDVRPHPDADRLTLVEVEAGAATVTVVCGARNLAAGDVVPYAPPGAQLADGARLERRTIRGVVSEGMLCSARELGLGDDHDGIMHLDGAAGSGVDVREVLGLDDVVLDLAITPNRPDAMSVLGVARELAAHFRVPMIVPAPEVPSGGAATEPPVVVDAPDRCPRFTARVAAVEMGQSPEWMARRLVLAGMRPISNVVDVTNYVMLERGQPMHAFDVDRLAGSGIVVRVAADGERMTTLDGVERVLTAEDLLVCDAERRAQGLAGIMGGGTSEVHDETTAILLEVAYFEPIGIARTSKRLGLRSEASARFERGVDPNRVLEASARAAELLTAVAGGVPSPVARDVYPDPVARPRIALRTARVNRVLGTELRADDVRDALAPLGIDLETADLGTTDRDDVVAVVPTFRPDLAREIDLVEEVARCIGFDRIGRTVPDTGVVGGLDARQRERRLLADVLVGTGLSEAVTIPLVAPADLTRGGAPVDRLVVAANPLRAEESVLRTRIVPGLLRAAARNRAQGFADVALFELGRVFLAPAAGAGPLPEEPDHAAAVLTGVVRRAPVEPDRAVDVYDGVDLVRAVADGLELVDLGFEAAPVPGLAPGRSARVVVDGTAAGTVGEVATEVLDAVGLEPPVIACELVIDRLLAGRRRDRTFRAPSRYPASTIDLAFVVADAVPADGVVRTLREAGGELSESVRLFDEFRADALGAGRRSLAFALRFRAPDRTLTDAEVGEVRRRCIEAVVATHGAEPRA